MGALPSGACDPRGQWLDASRLVAAEQVTFAATPGGSYFLVVVAYAGAEDSFNISVARN